MVVTIVRDAKGTVANLYLGQRQWKGLSYLNMYVHADDKPILTLRGLYLGTY